MEDEQLEIIKDFLVEGFETLDRLDQELVRLEQDPTNKEILNSIFRGIHTIKGTCGFLEFSKLEAVAHVGESLLDSLRSGKVLLSQEVATGLLQLVDAVRAMLCSIEVSQSEGAGNYDSLIERLKRLNESSDVGIIEKSLEEEFAAAVKEREVQEKKSQEDLIAEPFSVTGGDEGQKSSATENSLRVDVSILDSLMNLVGELVLARNQILQYTKSQGDTGFLGASQRLNLITSELQEGVMKTRMQPISNVWNKFPRIVRDVAKLVGKKVRLEMEGKETDLDKTIIEAIKDPLTHIVRNSVDHGIEAPDERKKNGKNSEGVITLRAFHEGGYVIIEIADDGAGLQTEKIKRKAIERGIVSAEKFLKMSEQEVHRLIFAPGFSTAEKVTNISGRGVGMDVVKSNIERIGGSVDITSTSGHGSTIKIKIPLTLAIIPALIISSGGERFAIPQVNLVELVRIQGHQILTQIEEIHGANFFRLRGDLLPLVYLNKEFGLKLKSNSENDLEDAKLNIVVIKADDRQFGLVVDAVHDTEEIVVKPLGKQLKNISVLAGATIMGDGHVALIIDVLGLAKRGRILSPSLEDGSIHKAKDEKDNPVDVQIKTPLLIVQAAKGYRTAIPLALVNRLEEFPATKIEIAGGSPVVQYRQGILPLVNLPKFFNAEECKKDLHHVIVYEINQSRVGFVVEHILDIVEEYVDLHKDQRRKGTLGSAIIQKKVTDVLDLESIISLSTLHAESTSTSNE